MKKYILKLIFLSIALWVSCANAMGSQIDTLEIVELDLHNFNSSCRGVARMPHPARDILDFSSILRDSVPIEGDSILCANVMQRANEFDNISYDWIWKPLGICDYGEDVILYYSVCGLFESCVYACLNPDQEGYPPTLLICCSGSDDWPVLWFEMEKDIITLYRGTDNYHSEDEKDRHKLKILWIEKYKIEDGQFKLVSTEHPENKFYDYSVHLSIISQFTSIRQLMRI